MATSIAEEELNQIRSRLRELENDSFDSRHNGNKHDPPDIPLIDPTSNVKDLVELRDRRQDDLRAAEFKRQDDLRKLTEHYNDKLVTERQRADSEAKKAEAGRINALLDANTNNVALALEKQGSQASAQDKRIAALEQNQYQGVGATGQRVEGQQHNQWMINLVIGIAGALFTAFITVAIAGVSIAIHYWK